MSAASSLAERKGVARIGLSPLPRGADVGLDLLDGEEAVLVGVDGLEVPEGRVDVLLQGDLPAVLVLHCAEDLGTECAPQLLDGEVADLLLVTEVEALGHRGLELGAIQLAVVVGVVLLHPGANVRSRHRLRPGRPRRDEQTQRARGDGGPTPRPHPCTFHEPSGCRQAVPHALSGLPSMMTSLWNSRQYVPPDW